MKHGKNKRFFSAPKIAKSNFSGKVLLLSLLLVLAVTPMVSAAVDFNTTLSSQEQQQVDKILAPIMKIYTFIKYVASVIGVLMFVFAGVSYMTAGGEHAKKDRAKHMAVGVIIGLIVIWVAPLVVNFVFS